MCSTVALTLDHSATESDVDELLTKWLVAASLGRPFSDAVTGGIHSVPRKTGRGKDARKTGCEITLGAHTMASMMREEGWTLDIVDEGRKRDEEFIHVRASRPGDQPIEYRFSYQEALEQGLARPWKDPSTLQDWQARNQARDSWNANREAMLWAACCRVLRRRTASGGGAQVYTPDELINAFGGTAVETSDGQFQVEDREDASPAEGQDPAPVGVDEEFPNPLVGIASGMRAMASSQYGGTVYVLTVADPDTGEERNVGTLDQALAGDFDRHTESGTRVSLAWEYDPRKKKFATSLMV